MIRIQNYIIGKLRQMSKLLCNVLKFSWGRKCPPGYAHLAWKCCMAAHPCFTLSCHDKFYVVMSWKVNNLAREPCFGDPWVR